MYKLDTTATVELFCTSGSLNIFLYRDVSSVDIWSFISTTTTIENLLDIRF